MKKLRVLLPVIGLVFFAAPALRAHCQIPCGIYADGTVFDELMTDVATIEKSMNEVIRLSEDPTANANQLVRWVNNKEAHAQNIQDTIAAYFLAQRIKLDPADDDARGDYIAQLERIHRITVYAMKCKQTVDLQYVEKLRSVLHDFRHAYGK